MRMDVIYEIDDALVRGLDYYGHTVFEIEANIKGFWCAKHLRWWRSL